MEYKYFGLLAFIIILCGLLFIVWKWPQGKHLTFSQHVAVARHTIVYYILLFATSLPILLTFFLAWFTPTFDLPIWFNVSLIIAALTQQACTFIPEVGGWKTRYHRILAGISGASLIPPLVFLLFSANIPTMGKLITSAGLLCMASVIGLVALRKANQHHLILQATYYAAFFVPILCISYLL